MINFKRCISFVLVFILILFSVFADEKRPDYLKLTTDIDGELVDYYCVRDEKALDKNFRMIVNDLTGQYTNIPSLTYLKKSMISEKYIKKYYPKYYNKYYKKNKSNSDGINYKDGYDYICEGTIHGSGLSAFQIDYKYESEEYFSLAMYYEGEWYYTKELLYMFENSYK